MSLRPLLLLTLAAAMPLAAQQTFTAVRAAEPPAIDGDLSDPVWATAPEITGFTQRDPDEGQPVSETTVVKIAYDDRAIYLGAYLYDRSPVTSRLGRRDTTLESDWFRIYLDPHLDQRTGATFQVNPANVQLDAILHSDSISDAAWDAVWESATRIVADGWVAEVAIPYSQLRFPARESHTWGINLARTISRRNELARLVFTPKGEAGFVSRFAHLTGLEGIRPGRGLEILPYAAARADRDGSADDDAVHSTGTVGLDLKYALTSNLTLTGTINPDFGQVEVDPARVNLTQFELFFPEKRPFFVEGSSLFEPAVVSNHIFSFNVEDPMLFYSRRIGRQPQSAGVLGASGAPDETTILGAAKVTGKTANGWTLALLDALTQEEGGSMIGPDGPFHGAVEPLTNYFAGRIAKDFGEKSAAGFRLTSVTRDLETHLQPILSRAAWTAAADGYRIFGDNDYVLQWTAAASRLEGSAAAIGIAQRSPARYFQRVDADHVQLDPSRTSLDGWGGTLLFAKHSGKWQYNLQTSAWSPGFESNDAGFMTRTDVLTTHAVLLYQDPDPWRNTRRRNFWVGKFQHWNFDGDLIQNGLWWDSNVTFENYRRAYAWGGIEMETTDDRATRGGPAILRPQRQWIGAQVGTDTRKPVSVDAWSEILRDEEGGWADVFAVSATWRPTSRLSLRATPTYRTARYPQQYVATRQGRYVFAAIDQKVIEIATRLDWTFTSRLSLQFYLQPYVATGDYHGFKEVARPRSLEFHEYGAGSGTIAYDPARDLYSIDPDGAGPAGTFTIADPDFNYRSLRGNAVLRWEFRPGSSLYVVWNESREDELPIGELDLRRDVAASFSTPARDVFMIKVSHWFGQ